MKRALTIAFFMIMVVCLAACNSSAVPTDEEVEAAYQQAVEAYSWFNLTTMPMKEDSRVDQDGYIYFEVKHDSIKSLADLESHLKKFFTDEIVAGLLADMGAHYVDIDGVLYATPADRGSNIFADKEYHKIVHKSDKEIVYQVTVDMLDEDLENVIDQEEFSFKYEPVDGKWVFTNFELVR
jgi:hypothetical protein